MDLLFRTGALGLFVEPESVLGGGGGACGGALGSDLARLLEVLEQ